MRRKRPGGQDKGVYQLHPVRSGDETVKEQGCIGLEPLYNQHVSHLFDGVHNILQLLVVFYLDCKI